MTEDSLEAQATRFAAALTATVRSIAADCDPFTPKVITDHDGAERFTVRQAPTEGIVLRVDSEPLFRLSVAYQCSLDSIGSYLAVDDAKVKVFAEDDKEPLFRYEYDRNAVSDMPAAHVQFHAHRDAFTHVMAKAGTSTARGKRRARGSGVPRISALHFPVGGHRFRPCLEDVLEMLITEFGVDSTEDGRRALRDGREAWRRAQVGAVVRDAPGVAIQQLETLGYEVRLKPSQKTPVGRPDRLRDF